MASKTPAHGFDPLGRSRLPLAKTAGIPMDVQRVPLEAPTGDLVQHLRAQFALGGCLQHRVELFSENS